MDVPDKFYELNWITDGLSLHDERGSLRIELFKEKITIPRKMAVSLRDAIQAWIGDPEDRIADLEKRMKDMEDRHPEYPNG